MNGARARLMRLERRTAPANVHPIPLICVERWPLPAQVAYRRAAAAGDHAAADALIEQQTGIRPAPLRPGCGVRIIEVRGVDPADI